jgi:RimJ/RimL family protein N-acetyltransferase
MRGTRFKDGKWYDSVVMGMLVDEYQRRKASRRLP